MESAASETRCRLCGASAVPFVADGAERYLRCGQCDLVFADVSETVVLGRNRQIYNETYAPDEVLEAPAEVPSRRKQRKYDRTLARLAPLGRPGRLLEIGCGDGEFLSHARNAGWDASGIEVAERAAAVARSRGLTVHTGTVEDADLASGSLDAVYMNEVLEHIFDPADVLLRIAALLRPGGLLFLRTRNPDSWTVRFCRERWHHFSVADCGHVSFLAPRTFRRVLPEVGLRIVSLRTWGSSYDDRYGHRQRLRRRLARAAGKALDPLAAWLEKGHRIEVVAQKSETPGARA